MWGRFPTFFYSLSVLYRGVPPPRYHVRDDLEAVVEATVDALGYDLVRLRRGGTRSRPVLEVRIDRRDGERVGIADCVRASRAIEARLDAGEQEGEGGKPLFAAGRYELQVSSPGGASRS